MKLKVRLIGRGLHEDEILVIVMTRDGEEEVMLDRDDLEGDAIEVGSPVGKSNGHLLVELPRETARGSWRVWVAKEELAFANA
ncbi:MAG TPA: hypothetical protein VF574_08670 [Allosphingosinicella sp.]